jgi:hypothetical protein
MSAAIHLDLLAPTRTRRGLTRRGIAVLLAVAVLSGAALDRLAFSWQHPAHLWLPSEHVAMNPGPWGQCVTVPFYISAPEETLPIAALETKGTHWLFPGFNPETLRHWLESAGVPNALAEALLDPSAISVDASGIDLKPSLAALTALPRDVRSRLYKAVHNIPNNVAEISFFHEDSIDERFAGSGVSDETLALFRQLCGQEGHYVVFSGLGTMLAQLPSHEEKVRFARALTRQKTMLFKVRVGPDSNIPALTGYWAKGPGQASDRALLESLATVKEGTWISIKNLLPPLAAVKLYEYPIASDLFQEGQPVVHDCHWSSFNFFRERPDPAVDQPGRLAQLLQEEYYPVPNTPAYGDILMLSKPDGTVLHSAVYLADDVVFTKNGSTVAYPWMLSTIDELKKRYSFDLPEGQELSLKYFRSYAY